MAIAVVQVTKSADTNDGALTTVATQAFGSAPTAANCITGHVSWQGVSTADLLLISDDASGGSNTYSIIDSITVSGSDFIQMATFVAQNIKSGASALTVTAAFAITTSFRRISAQEWSGVSTTGQPNNHKINASATFGTGTDAVTSTTATTTVDGCEIIGYGYDESAATIPTVGTGFTSRDSATFGAGDAFGIESKSQATQGSVASTFTTSGGTDSIGAAMLAIAPSAAASDALFGQALT